MEIEVLKEILEPIVELHKKYSDEILLQFTDRELTVITVDPAHVAMGRTEIPAKAFEAYDVDKNGVKIGIDIDKLNNLLKLETKGNTFKLFWDKDKDFQLIVTHGNLTHKIGLLSADCINIPSIPKIDFNNSATVDLMTFQKSVKSISNLTEIIQMAINPDRLELLKVIDSDSDDDRIKSEITGEINVKDGAITNFSMDYFNNISKSLKKFSKEIKISNDTNCPVKIEIETDTLKHIDLLAPRMDDVDQNDGPEYSFSDIETYKDLEMNNVESITINGIRLEFQDNKFEINTYGKYETINLNGYSNPEILKNGEPIKPPEPDNDEPDLEPAPEIENTEPDNEELGPEDNDKSEIEPNADIPDNEELVPEDNDSNPNPELEPKPDIPENVDWVPDNDNGPDNEPNTDIPDIKTNTWRDNIPADKVEIKANLEQFADDNNLIINPYVESKIEWMELHGGQCYCEPSGERSCPCEHALNDVAQFNGACLCRVLVTQERLEALKKQIMRQHAA